MNAKIVKMLLNGIENPIGYDTNSLSFSWIVKGTKSKFQKSARVIISTDPSCDISKKDQLIHDSGESSEINSIDYDPQIDTKSTLKPRTRYYWKVIVTTDLDERIESPINFFETSKLNEPWTAKWISTEKVGKEDPPYVRKTFSIPDSKKVKEARIYSTGLGAYELYINGSKPTDEYFLPSNNNYKLWVQYQTFDVTQFVRPNINTIGVILGDGWARCRCCFGSSLADLKTKYRGMNVDCVIDRYEFLFELHLLYDDGTTEIINSDKTWKCHKSDILMSTIYEGEYQDSNFYINNWNSFDCDETDWFECIEIDEPLHQKLVPRFSLPIVIKKHIKPVKLIKTPKNELIIDMGQNMTGWLEMKIKASKGFEVVIEHCEILQEGNFYNGNIGNGLEQFRYISNGIESTVRPHFTYYGFRYVRLTKWEGPIFIKNFVGCVVYSDLEIVGNLETGNSLVNKLISNSLWSQKDNFFDVPTDCPQRAERLGWTGDAQIFCKTAMFNMNCYAFYRKYLKDLYLHQLRDNGIPPLWCPQLITLDEVRKYFPTEGMIGWSDAATIIPWNVYLMNGKKQILQDQYDGMKKWIEVMSKNIKDGLWKLSYTQFCDWLALDGPDNLINKNHVFGGTENTFICTTFYYYSLTLIKKAAKVLCKKEDYEKYQKLAEDTLNTIRDEYFTPKGRCAIQTQTALSLAIVHGLQPEGTINASLASLSKLLQDRDYHLCTGFIGTQILCKALTMAGNNRDAVTTFLQDTYPGWLYPVKMGATTIWERWGALQPDGKVSPEGMNSFNHYAYGSICEWIYCDICGLNPVEDYPGFKRVILKPHPDHRLIYANASHNSPMGRFECGWIINKKKVKYNFSIPFNVVAKLVLLNLKKNDVISSSFETKEEGNDIVAELTNGEYEIVYKYNTFFVDIPEKFK
ncbi:hypothetical protein M9Y10_014528 [Tritrichomonas musculus]|uniref:alpha-L-rhamnosidase n=1 Tax=Tritrichomonas musculus TaxID=1915356 RepID=A0ABR2KZS6_9EUKA